MASRSESFGWLALLLVVVLWPSEGAALWAQERAGLPVEISRDGRASEISGLIASAGDVPATADAVLEQMSLAAGMIFAGRVTAVRRPAGFAGSDGDAGTGIVEVDFRVEQAVRGPVTGSVYTLREWSGLWGACGGGARYRVGQRLLLFLYAPDAHGLSSPVHGLDGAVPLRGGGVAPGAVDTTNTAAQWMADLRWVQARALRGSPLRMPPVLRQVLPRAIHGIGPDEGVARSAVESELDLVRREPVPFAMATTAPVETQPLAQVIALCEQAIRRADAER